MSSVDDGSSTKKNILQNQFATKNDESSMGWRDHHMWANKLAISSLYFHSHLEMQSSLLLMSNLPTSTEVGGGGGEILGW